jgi:hypothetical protein
MRLLITHLLYYTQLNCWAQNILIGLSTSKQYSVFLTHHSSTEIYSKTIVERFSYIVTICSLSVDSRWHYFACIICQLTLKSWILIFGSIQCHYKLPQYIVVGHKLIMLAFMIMQSGWFCRWACDTWINRGVGFSPQCSVVNLDECYLNMDDRGYAVCTRNI